MTLLRLLLVSSALVGGEPFEVAAIKPTSPEWTAGRFLGMESGNRFIARNHSLKTLIAAAYNLSPHTIIGGPEWAESQRFDILAKTPGNSRPTLEQQMSMLRALLAERFQLTHHLEERTLPVYSLTLARSGAKLKESVEPFTQSPAGPPPLIFVISPQLVRLPGRFATTADLASVLQRSALDRPVLDNTGLTARYDFDLEFTPDESLFGGVLGKPPHYAHTPGLFTAIQHQLGLRLEPTRGPVAMFVIENASRPAEN